MPCTSRPRCPAGSGTQRDVPPRTGRESMRCLAAPSCCAPTFAGICAADQFVRPTDRGIEARRRTGGNMLRKLQQATAELQAAVTEARDLVWHRNRMSWCMCRSCAGRAAANPPALVCSAGSQPAGQSEATGVSSLTARQGRPNKDWAAGPGQAALSLGGGAGGMLPCAPRQAP